MGEQACDWGLIATGVADLGPSALSVSRERCLGHGGRHSPSGARRTKKTRPVDPGEEDLPFNQAERGDESFIDSELLRFADIGGLGRTTAR